MQGCMFRQLFFSLLNPLSILWDIFEWQYQKIVEMFSIQHEKRGETGILQQWRREGRDGGIGGEKGAKGAAGKKGGKGGTLQDFLGTKGAQFYSGKEHE